ncbi:MAG TPA: DUF2306 domain-containing protein [Methylomirabilota bacterium]|nr:DUF2306 domain-containing protein [Methylomirabilota bacterium]
MNHTVPVKQQAILGMSWMFFLLLIIAVPLVIRFLLVYAARYVSWDPQVYGDTFWPRRYGLLIHIAGSSVAIVTGPVQLWLGETRWALAWHRTLGAAYLLGVTVGCLGGYYLALTTRDYGWVYASGLFGLAVAWTITTGMAYWAIRRRLIDQHREWMIRSYVVTLAFVFGRLFEEVAVYLGVSDFSDVEKATVWLSWAVPLLLTEPFLQLRKFRQPMLAANPKGYRPASESPVG